MKTFIHSIALGLFLVFSLIAKSQNLGIDSTATNLGSLPDTINLNDNYTHTIVVQNKSAISITDTIYLVGAIDSSGTLISIDTIGSAIVTNFNFNDTVSISYNENYTYLNSYKIGGNIVVVWPVTGSASTVDTLFKNVFIEYPLSINSILGLDKQLIIYPNPAKDYIFIKNNHQKITIKQVRIVDVYGRIVYHEKFNPRIDISKLINGTYFIYLKLCEENEFYYQFIKN